ncbi:MAG: hypothetical protein Q8P17_03915 [bacterium]|nr:hypothetical protein [bacterium]
MAEEAEEKELGFWFEGRTDSKRSSELIGWYQKDLTEMFGVYGLVSMESDDRFRQGYAGLTAKPLPSLLPWLQVGAGLGRERDSESSGVRRNMFVSVDAEKIDGFATYEDGPLTGPWHRWNVVYHVTDKISIGAMQETNLGIAPRLEYHIKKNLTILGEIFKDSKRLAVNFSF